MKKERVILSFIALLIGLAVAGGAFYVYQQTRTTTEDIKSETVVNISEPTPTDDAHTLVIERPQNEAVVTSQTVTVSGKALPETTIVAQTETDEQVAKTSSNGNFQFTIEINDGLNIFTVTAMYPDGTQKTEQRVITYSQEDF